MQLVRVLVDPRFGWTVGSMKMMRWFDLVAICTDQLRRWIPYVVYYVLACIVTLALIANSALIIKLLRAGGLKAQWPLTTLRFIVRVFLVVFFTTVLEWLLYPADCAADDMSLSAWMHGAGSECTPFALPEVFVLALSAILVLIFSGFNPTSYTLHPTPYTLHPTPHTLHPTPHTLNPKPHTPNPKP